MREEIVRIKCTECIARVSIENTAVEFERELPELLNRLAAHLKWDVENRKCPIHRSKG